MEEENTQMTLEKVSVFGRRRRAYENGKCSGPTNYYSLISENNA